MASITESLLPELDSPRIRQLQWLEDSDHYRAYVCILQVEKATTDADKLVSVRIAGYMLIEFTTHDHIFGRGGSAQLTKWIITPPLGLSPQSEQDKMIGIGELLRDKLIRMFRTETVYSQPVSHPSRPSFDSLEDMIKDAMECTSDDHSTSKRKALARDGFRCVITGIYDRTSVKNSAELRNLKNIQTLTLKTAHIFNASSMKNIDPAVSDDDPGEVLNKTRTAAAALATLNMFGFSDLTDIFMQSGGVHEVWNLMMLEHNLRSDFNQLYLWFEHTEKPHRYKVCTFDPSGEQFINNNFSGHDRHMDGAPGFVELNSQHEEAPPPSPLLLALHATCARVAHMSGAAEFFDRMEQDVEDMKVLARDGSSASLLTNLLSPYVDHFVKNHEIATARGSNEPPSGVCEVKGAKIENKVPWRHHAIR